MAPKSLGIGQTSGMWWVGGKKLPVGDGFAIARLVLLQNESNNKQWLHVFLHASIFEIQISILRLCHRPWLNAIA
jgi:hypothetical protein